MELHSRVKNGRRRKREAHLWDVLHLTEKKCPKAKVPHEGQKDLDPDRCNSRCSEALSTGLQRTRLRPGIGIGQEARERWRHQRDKSPGSQLLGFRTKHCILGIGLFYTGVCNIAADDLG